MYKAKTTGKGHFQVFHPTMGEAVLERHGLKEELRLAIERQQLTLYFQPIIDLDTGALVAEEALVRWEHPRRGLVGPSEFVPLAEETGLILSLGDTCSRRPASRRGGGRPGATPTADPGRGPREPQRSRAPRSRARRTRARDAVRRGVEPRA